MEVGAENEDSSVLYQSFAEDRVAWKKKERE
jgi:hypothetical protein